MLAIVLRVAVLAAIAGLPFVETNSYWIHVFGLAAISAILAMGLQLLVGMAGLLSLGQAAFYGIGAYASAIATTNFQVPFPLAFLAAGVTASVASLLLIPIVRLKGPSLAVATLGFGIIVHLVLLNEDWLTGGSIGMMGIVRPGVGNYTLESEQSLYYLCVVVAIAVFLLLDRLQWSRFGRALQAICQDEDAARASGVAIVRTKSKCFLIAAFTAGLAGSLYAHVEGYLSPDDFDLTKSIDVLIMAVVGGLGSLPGAAVGAVVLVVSTEFLRISGEFRMIIVGVAVIVLMGVKRRGLVGLLNAAYASLLAHRSKRLAAIVRVVK
jgi:branched-chain amino acid transport system permease protein